MVIKKERIVYDYYNVCEICQEEFLLSFNTKATLCDECIAKYRKEQVLNNLKKLLGAKIIRIEPKYINEPKYIDPYEIVLITVETNEGKKVEFIPNDEYIERLK